jgi:hypothetical protein
MHVMLVVQPLLLEVIMTTMVAQFALRLNGLVAKIINIHMFSSIHNVCYQETANGTYSLRHVRSRSKHTNIPSINYQMLTTSTILITFTYEKVTFFISINGLFGIRLFNIRHD